MSLLLALVLAAASTTAPAAKPAEKKEEKARPSPAASVSQTVSLTKITVDYSSPAVKGREIFGKLVPYGQVWRTGANEATRITFANDVQVGGTNLPAGTYGLFTLPTEKGWTFIFNKTAAQWGAYEYKQADDVARVPASAPEAIPARERMAFIFSNTNDTTTRLDLEWDKTRVSLPITVSK